MRRETLGLALIGLLAAARAGATPYIATSEDPEAKIRRTEVHTGILVGNSDIGDVSGPGVGVEIDVGRRFGDFTLLGQFDYLGVGESRYEVDARRGSLARVGLMARYSVFEVGERRDPIRYDFWVEAGGGRQRVAWEQGGTLTRNDVMFGFGTQLDAKLRRGSKSPVQLGPYFAFRANVARAPVAADDAMPTCGGPCDTATAPTSSDISLFFHFGLHWGR